jgi:hypothetical protein
MKKENNIQNNYNEPADKVTEFRLNQTDKKIDEILNLIKEIDKKLGEVQTKQMERDNDHHTRLLMLEAKVSDITKIGAIITTLIIGYLMSQFFGLIQPL